MRSLAPVLIVAAITSGAACSTAPESMPASPSALLSESGDVQRGVPDRPAIVSLRGTIRDLNDRHTQFTLVLPATDGHDSRSVVIRLDEHTVISSDGRGARRGLLQNGLLCGVDGIQRDDFVLARKIIIVRHSDRR